MAETPEKGTQEDKQPEAVPQGPSSRVTATVVSLAALAIIGAATANSLPNFSVPNFSVPNFSRPNFDGFSLPKFDRISFPNLDRVSLPNFDRIALPKFDFSWPNFNRSPAPKSNRLAAPSPSKPAPAPDPIVSAALRDIQLSQRDIQSSQQQNATTLVSLTESSATQQADLRRISRQLSTLTAQVQAMHGAVSPLTTGSIPQSNPRARVIRTSRKTAPPQPPPLPRPVGPVSVGGAPLNSTPAADSGV